MRSDDITTANGLLYRSGQVIHLPDADRVATHHGHMNAERMVKHLEQLAGWHIGQRARFDNGRRKATGEIYDITRGPGDVVKLAISVTRGGKPTQYSIDADFCERVGKFAALQEAKQLGGWSIECRNAGPSDMVHYRYIIGHLTKCPDWESDQCRNATWDIKDARREALARINEIEAPYTLL
jgi:hypothetical protein